MPDRPWGKMAETLPAVIAGSAPHGFSPDWVAFNPQKGYFPTPQCVFRGIVGTFGDFSESVPTMPERCPGFPLAKRKYSSHPPAPYYNQNLALFALGWYKNVFRFGIDGSVIVRWQKHHEDSSTVIDSSGSAEHGQYDG